MRLADRLRAMACRALHFRRNELISNCLVEGDYDAYYENMIRHDAFDGELEIYALADMLRVAITVYAHADDGRARKIATYGERAIHIQERMHNRQS